MRLIILAVTFLPIPALRINLELESKKWVDKFGASIEAQLDATSHNLQTLIDSAPHKRHTTTVTYLGDSGPSTPLSNDKILFATVETRDASENHRLPGPVGWDYGVHNLGAGKMWTHDYSQKIGLMQSWVATLSDDQLVAFMDGGDVMYGGCDQADLLQRFETISNLTKSPIIFGAEAFCYGAPTNGCAKYPVHGRDEVLNAHHLTAEDLDHWLVQAPKALISLKYLNSGFYMGRVKDLKQLYVHMLSVGPRKGYDQGLASQVFQDHPDLVALDYAGLLVNNLAGVNIELNGIQHFPYQDSTKQWINTVTKKPVCFFHGNSGDAKKYLVQLEDELSATAN